MSNFISTSEESTHSLSVMSILLSLAGCGTQDVHSDYQIQETHSENEIPYIVLVPLSPGLLYYYQYIYTYSRNLFLILQRMQTWSSRVQGDQVEERPFEHVNSRYSRIWSILWAL
jgi:hypothetical protein